MRKSVSPNSKEFQETLQTHIIPSLDASLVQDASMQNLSAARRNPNSLKSNQDIQWPACGFMKYSYLGALDMDLNIVFFTGLVSIFTQYCAVILAAICVVDFFSYKTRKLLFIALPYLFLLPVVFSAVSIFWFHALSNSALPHLPFTLSHYNLTAASTLHLLLGLMIVGMYLSDIWSRTKSRAIQLRRAHN